MRHWVWALSQDLISYGQPGRSWSKASLEEEHPAFSIKLALPKVQTDGLLQIDYIVYVPVATRIPSRYWINKLTEILFLKREQDVWLSWEIELWLRTCQFCMRNGLYLLVHHKVALTLFTWFTHLFLLHCKCLFYWQTALRTGHEMRSTSANALTKNKRGWRKLQWEWHPGDNYSALERRTQCENREGNTL